MRSIVTTPAQITGPLRVGVIGCGYVSHRHLQAWKRLDGVELAAVCDLDRDRAESMAEHFGVPAVYADAGEMIREAGIHVVDIVTRPASHKPLVALCAEHGKHVLCQKPLAPTLTQAQEMVETCERAGVRFMACENWRWHEWYRKARELLDAGLIGKIRRMHFQYNRLLDPHNMPTEYGAAQTYFLEMERLVVYEFGIHLIDCLRSLVGDPASVCAATARINPVFAGEDAATITFEHDGFYSLIDINWSDPFLEGETLQIDGEDGSLRLEAGVALEVKGKETLRIPYSEKRVEQVRLESHFALHEHFVRALLEGQPFVTEARDNLKTLRAVFAAYRAAEESRCVALLP